MSMANILFIDNDYEAHYEILESIIVNYKTIIGNVDIDTIYLNIRPNPSFSLYIQKHINVILEKPTNYDYYIRATLYPEDYKFVINKNKTTHFYISHRVSNIYNNASNIFYLTPLAKNNVFIANILPYKEEKRPSQIPVFIIPGDINRRNKKLLKILLTNNFRHEFKIKLFGKEHQKEFINDRVKQCINYDWESYHKEFLDCYCILPLITFSSHPQYYSTTLTSSINYIMGYNTKSIVDKNLQNIYNIPNAVVFDKEEDIVKAFEQLLNDFYAE